MPIKTFVIALLSVVMLSGCAETQFLAHMAKQVPESGKSKQQGVYKIGNPYKIDGEWYQPTESYSYTETGIASWYGPDFHGKSTANGEKYDQYALTAAHRTLQLPSIVRVTNLENGRSIKVRVNDRGPFSKGRIIDMSRKGAELLGFIGAGTARVRVDVLPVESKIVSDAAKQGKRLDVHEVERLAAKQSTVHAQPIQVAHQEQLDALGQQTEPFQSVNAVQVQPVQVERIAGEDVAMMPVHPTALYVQAGAFSVHENAVQTAAKLKTFGSTQISETTINGTRFYRVRLGPFQRVQDADAKLAQLSSVNGMSNARIIVDNKK